MNRFFGRSVVTTAIFLGGIFPAFSAGWKTLPGHVPKIISSLTANGIFPETNQLRLAIGLPLRDPAGLEKFLAEVYDPASPNFRHFLTPEEFTARFGPTAENYAAVENFALTNGLAITGTHGNRLVLDVSGNAAAIDRAFQITLRTYRHPGENRNFFAPDTEPLVDAALPVADISGLNNFLRPHPKSHRTNLAAKGIPKSGSGSGGAYFGNDFRTAYVPGTTLTGAGQSIGLFEFDGFYSNDITAYERAAGLTNIPIQTVLIDSVTGTPGYSGVSGADDEVSLDIELPIAMAPGLSSVIVFEGNTENDILDVMVASNQVKQLSCSWAWDGGPSTTTDAIFQQMAAQGQSFFNASGDDDAFTVGANSVNGVDNTSLVNAPSSSPYITQVGATTLTTAENGSWSSETVWNIGYDQNFNGYVGSSGGVSSYYSIPSWQTNISMAANGGSTTQRNIPDVTIVGDNILVYSENGGSRPFSGTSCAAPLWAAFTALVNEQLTAAGGAPIGFLNPPLYNIGKSSNYAIDFNDITSGNNEWPSSPSQYVAASGYDLCSGWGSPTGTNLINALANLNGSLGISPTNGFSALGVTGGLFSPSSQVFLLTNSGVLNLNWSVSHVPAWLTVTPAGGTLLGFAQTNVTLTFSSAASSLVVGSYATNIWFSNNLTPIVQTRPVALQIVTAMQIAPTNANVAVGSFGGPFAQNFSACVVSNVSPFNFNWSLSSVPSWLSPSPTNGVAPANGGSTVALNFSPAAFSLAAGNYTNTLRFTNLTSHTSQALTSILSIGQNILVNGPFETGDFTGWTLVGDTTNASGFFNGVVGTTTFPGSSQFIHAGNHGAALGEHGFLATLAQTVLSVPGQTYLLSFWLTNPTNLPTEQFQVNWNSNTIYNILNPPVFGWTNLDFFVSATGTNSTLQFAAENDHFYFGLDGVTLTPIPAIAFESMVQATNTYRFNWDAATGLVYQVQYKTNLLQTNWFNLGTAITARTNTLTIADTNALILSPQRFYRLGVSP